MFRKIFVSLVCFTTALLAAHNVDTYFNSTEYALNVYGHIYYDPVSGKPLEGAIENDSRLPFSLPKIGFRGLPCVCSELQCGCCAGINFTTIKLDRRYCANFTFELQTFTVNVKVMMNDNEVFSTSVSARNPPPMCVPLPYLPVVDFCLRLYDLSLPNGSSLQTCLDFEARLAHSPLLVMHFNCVRLGSSGVAWIKPGDAFGNNETTLLAFPPPSTSPSPSPSPSTTRQPASDVYDEVDFEAEPPLVAPADQPPEQQDNVGQHRIP